MKVFQNIDNYDPYPQHTLGQEECEILIAELKRVITDLIPLRSNKRKTREYCEKYLRIDRHKDECKHPDKYGIPPKFPLQEYSPIPGEVLISEAIFHPAIVSVIADERYSFGYVWNLIYSYIEEDYAGGIVDYEGISDQVIQFALSFDIDTIRVKAKQIPDYKERIQYLNTIITDSKVYKGLEPQEEEKIARPFQSAMQALIEETEREWTLESKDSGKKLHNKKELRGEKSAASAADGKSAISRNVLYDLSLCSEPKYEPLRYKVHGDCLTKHGPNLMSFVSLIQSVFDRCYDQIQIDKPNEELFNLFPNFIWELMDLYSARMSTAYKHSPRTGLQKMYQWVRSTFNVIDNVYQGNKKIIADEPTADETGYVYFPFFETYTFKEAIVRPLFQHFTLCVSDFDDGIPEEVESIVPFNMWNEQFESLRNKYRNQLGLESEKRAIINIEDNKRRFSLFLADQCYSFCNRFPNLTSTDDREGEVSKHADTINSMLHSYFRDYISRVQKVIKDREIIDLALLNWILTLQQVTYISYTEHANYIIGKCSSYNKTDYSISRFFIDMCMKDVFEIAVEYFQDSARMPLVADIETQGSEVQAQINPPVASESDTSSSVNVAEKYDTSTAGESEGLYSHTIDFETLYSLWNTKAFINTTKEDFKNSVKNADFKLMREKANNAGHKSGYLGALKCIIKCLGAKLGMNWYDKACNSIGETHGSVDKLNDGTVRCTNIKKTTWEKCIKPNCEKLRSLTPSVSQ